MMPWVKLDDAFPEHPKVLAAGDEAAWLYVCALAYCNRHLTDGFVPSAAVRRLTGHKSPLRLVMKLVDIGLLERDDPRQGFVVHDFLSYQPSKASIEAERAGARERMAKVRERSRDVRPNIDESASYPVPSHPVSHPVSVPLSSSSSDNSGNGSHDDDDDDERIGHAIDIHAAWRARKADDPDAYAPKVRATDRVKSRAILIACLQQQPELTARDLAERVFKMDKVAVRDYDPRRPR